MDAVTTGCTSKVIGSTGLHATIHFVTAIAAIVMLVAHPVSSDTAMVVTLEFRY